MAKYYNLSPFLLISLSTHVLIEGFLYLNQLEQHFRRNEWMSDMDFYEKIHNESILWFVGCLILIACFSKVNFTATGKFLAKSVQKNDDMEESSNNVSSQGVMNYFAMIVKFYTKVWAGLFLLVKNISGSILIASIAAGFATPFVMACEGFLLGVDLEKIKKKYPLGFKRFGYIAAPMQALSTTALVFVSVDESVVHYGWSPYPMTRNFSQYAVGVITHAVVAILSFLNLCLFYLEGFNTVLVSRTSRIAPWYQAMTAVSTFYRVEANGFSTGAFIQPWCTDTIGLPIAYGCLVISLFALAAQFARLIGKVGLPARVRALLNPGEERLSLLDGQVTPLSNAVAEKDRVPSKSSWWRCCCAMPPETPIAALSSISLEYQ